MISLGEYFDGELDLQKVLFNFMDY